MTTAKKKLKTMSEVLESVSSDLDGMIIDPKDLNPFDTVDAWSPMGLPSLEKSLGILGLPTGIIELSGKSLSGKTTLAACGARGFLEDHDTGVVLVLYSEMRYNADYLEDMGIDMSRVRLINARYVEEMFLKIQVTINKIANLFAENDLDDPKFYCIWDSVSSTYSKAEKLAQEENQKKQETAKDNEIGKEKKTQLAAFAVEAKRAMKYITAQIYERSISFICISHTMPDLKSPNAMARKSSGGEWLEYMPTLRLELSRISDVKLVKDGEPEGQITKVRVKKNDFGRRGQEIKIELVFGFGFVLSDDDLDLGEEFDLLVKYGHGYKCPSLDIQWKSKKEFYNLYKQRDERVHELRRMITKEVHNELMGEKKRVSAIKERNTESRKAVGEPKKRLLKR